MSIPDYEHLPINPSHPPRSAWGLWGDDDELGTLNLLGEAQAVRGLECAKKGHIFPLNLRLDRPDPPFYGRDALVHTIFRNEVGFDDKIDNFFPQAGSQWDSLSHVAHPVHGFWNGRTAEEFTGVDGTKNGIDNFARKGMAARGVLLDMPRYLESVGRPVDGGSFREFSVDELDAARKAAGITIEEGDVLLIRSGWLEWYNEAGEDVKASLAQDSFTKLNTPGLAGGEEMAEYLWNLHIAAVASDAPALEAWPHRLEVDQYLHFRLIPLLGLSLGELWDLEALAADCAEDGIHEFLLTSAPLNLVGGVGSPANALAIK